LKGSILVTEKFRYSRVSSKPQCLRVSGEATRETPHFSIIMAGAIPRGDPVPLRLLCVGKSQARNPRLTKGMNMKGMGFSFSSSRTRSIFLSSTAIICFVYHHRRRHHLLSLRHHLLSLERFLPSPIPWTNPFSLSTLPEQLPAAVTYRVAVSLESFSLTVYAYPS
jgi:hypothetical protein